MRAAGGVWGQTLYVGSNQGANMPGNERAFLTFMVKGEWGDEYSMSGLTGRGRDYTQARSLRTQFLELCMNMNATREEALTGMYVFTGVQDFNLGGQPEMIRLTLRSAQGDPAYQSASTSPSAYRTYGWAQSVNVSPLALGSHLRVTVSAS
jgi:hypothetical protein